MDHRASTSDFASAYRHGFARVAACTLPVAAGDPARNAEAIVEQVRLRHEEGVAVALFPELSLSGYAIDDLLLQDVLLDEDDRAVVTVAAATKTLLPVVVVGAPLRHGNRLFNCAVVIHRGEVLGVVDLELAQVDDAVDGELPRHQTRVGGHRGEPVAVV
jgi:NAD+ synthase (glutamine-hydrolysing)